MGRGRRNREGVGKRTRVTGGGGHGRRGKGQGREVRRQAGRPRKGPVSKNNSHRIVSEGMIGEIIMTDNNTRYNQKVSV
jgi:hypothetical protein